MAYRCTTPHLVNTSLVCSPHPGPEADILTDEFVKDGVLDVILRDGVFAIHNLQLGALLKRVLLEAEQEEDATESLWREEGKGSKRGVRVSTATLQ